MNKTSNSHKIYQNLFQPISRLHRIYYFLKSKFWYSRVLKKCGKGILIIKPIYLTPKNIILGNTVSIWNNARIEGVENYLGEKYIPYIIFHDSVSIQQNLHLTCANKIEIGKNTAIAANVTITDINHQYINIDLPIEKQPIDVFPVSIGEDCKIYNNVVILPGSTIGKHCTIGANSVVNGIIPDYCVAVGSPAKIIKRYSFEKQVWLKTDKVGNFIEL